MHELAATKALIEMIENECRSHHIERPKKIIAELGSLKSYRADPVMFYFDILKKENPILSEAELDIIDVQAKLRCNSCGKDSLVTQPYLLFCEHCDSRDVEIIEGKDFKLKEIIR